LFDFTNFNSALQITCQTPPTSPAQLKKEEDKLASSLYEAAKKAGSLIKLGINYLQLPLVRYRNGSLFLFFLPSPHLPTLEEARRRE
jgi:hypothetical protein